MTSASWPTRGDRSESASASNEPRRERHPGLMEANRRASRWDRDAEMDSAQDEPSI